MRRVDLKLGFACNNRCSFCVQGDKRSRHGRRGLEQAVRDLREAREGGARELVITGGEPTLDRDVFRVARHARELGYANIQIQTNGRRFCYEPVCQAAIAAGVTEFSPALHGPSPDVHDALTRAPGSFEQTLQGIRNLVRLRQRVVVNTVINSENYPHLPALADLLVSLRVHQFQFAFVHIVGTAADNRDWLVPRKREVMPFVHQGLEVGQAAGVSCMTEAIPYCLMPGYESFVAETVIPQATVYDADRVIADYTQYRRSEGKAKREACRACRWDEQCEGPWREYPERFGWEEFEPVLG